MANLTLFPLQFKRQDSVPIDLDDIFSSTADRTAYLSSPRRYAGQIVADNEQQLVYFLNAARDAWIAVGGGNSVSTAPYDISMFLGGPMDNANEISSGALVPRTVFISATEQHLAKALVAPTALALYAIVKITAGVQTQIGTITFNAAATTGTVVVTTNTTLVAGDTIGVKVLTIASDPAIQDVFVTIIGCATLASCALP